MKPNHVYPVRRLALPLKAGLVCCLLISNALANTTGTSIGLKFAATDPDYATSGLNASDSAGVIPSVNWNNLTNASGSFAAVKVDSSGTSVATPVSVTWSSPNTWRSGANNAFPAGPNKKLLSGYLDTGNTTANGVFITVSNLPSSFTTYGYDVYVYFVRDATNNTGGAYTITNETGFFRKYGSTLPTPSSFVEDPGTDVNNSQDGTHLRFTGLGGTWFTLKSDTTLTTPNGGRAPINAIEIVALPACTPAGIATQPASASACSGSTVMLSTGATGSLPSYQWRRNGVNLADGPTGSGSVLSGVNSATLVIASTAVADTANAGEGYDCSITVACDGTTTNSARVALTINPAATLFAVTGGGTDCSGAGVPVGLDGSEIGVDYRLRTNGVFSGVVVTGTGAPLDFGNQLLSRTYTVQASNTLGGCTALMSGSAAVTVIIPPAITSGPSPAEFTNYLGASALFAVTVPSSQFTYQWRRDGTNLANGGNLSGVTSTNLKISPLTAADGVGVGHGYSCVVSGSCGLPVTSVEATLTVIPLPNLVGVWTNRYAGTANLEDVATALAFDANGNVLVTGYSKNSANFNTDFYIAKYAAADGALVWEKRGKAPDTSHDSRPSALIVDQDGNAVITGSGDLVGYVAKYATTDGTLIWQDSPLADGASSSPGNALAMDANGNVLVAASARYFATSTSDIVVRKYAGANGSRSWERPIGLTGGSAEAAAVAVDGNGDVVVTGYGSTSSLGDQCVTAKISGTSGALLWLRTYNGPAASNDRLNALALDSSGNAIVTGLSDYNYYTAKYASADGVLIWEKTYSGAGVNLDQGKSVVVDASDNVFVTGSSWTPTAQDDWYTAKYAAADGALLWEARYSSGIGGDQAATVKLDAYGNALVAGTTWAATGNFDYNLIMYGAADGAVLWSAKYNGPANGHEQITSKFCLAVNPAGEIALTGGSDGDPGPSTVYDFLTLKFSPFVAGNGNPTLAIPLSDTNAICGTSFSFTFAANTFTDPDAGQTLTFSAVGMPAGITFSPATRTFSGTPTAVGTNSVTVTATDNGTPTLSTNDVFDIVIIKAPLTATADNKSRAYGQANPALTITYSGFVLGESDSALNTPPIPATTATSASPVGPYPITLGGGADDHYAFNYVNGTLNITPASLTVAAFDTNRVYGTTNPPLAGSIIGLVNGDNITASFTTAATIASPPGTYPITAILNDPDGKLGNYAVTTNNGTLTINGVAEFQVEMPPGTNLATGTAIYFGGMMSRYVDPASQTQAPDQTFTVTFTGIFPNPYAAYQIQYADSPFGIWTPLPASGLAPDAGGTIQFHDPTPRATAFYRLRIDTDTHRVFTIRNTGTNDLSGIGVGGTGTSAANFELDLNGTAAVLSPGASTTFAVTYVAFDTNARSAELSITANVPSLFVLTLIGGDVAPPNHAPDVANPIPDTNGIYGSPMSFTFVANTFSDPDAGQSLTYSASGLPPEITFTPATRTFSGTPTNVGTSSVTVTATDNGSPALSTNDVFDIVIAKAPLTATADNKSRTYAETNPPLTFSYSAFVLGETAAVLDTPPTIDTTATNGSAVGSYLITIGGGADDHYELNYVNGTLNITPASLTVAAFDTNRVYGTPNPPLGGSLVGVAWSDNITATFNSPATISDPPGTYPITPVFSDPDGKLGNYSVTTNIGTLTILSPPELAFTLGGSGGGLFTLSWPASYAGFVLEYSESLTPPIDWQPVTSGITESGGTKSYTVTNDTSVSGRLYRLRLP